MGNLHVLNTINLHQQLRTMVKHLNESFKSVVLQHKNVLLASDKSKFLVCFSQEDGTVLGNMTTIDSKDLQNMTDSKNLFHFPPHQTERYLLL